jgi:DNA helicase II / ATP-dependent DNA helicase PcrA
MPYARLTGLPVPDPVALATTRQIDRTFTRAAEKVLRVGQPYELHQMSKYRRVHLDRDEPGWQSDPDLAAIAEVYEALLREAGLIDLDDLVIFGNRLLAQHDWVLLVIKARFPVLAVREYQDLGIPLQRIVKRLVFDGDVRLFAVGDADQSVYGFNGADSVLLRELAARPDVEVVRL